MKRRLQVVNWKAERKVTKRMMGQENKRQIPANAVNHFKEIFWKCDHTANRTKAGRMQRERVIFFAKLETPRNKRVYSYLVVELKGQELNIFLLSLCMADDSNRKNGRI